MNRITIIGRLGRDPEAKTTQGGKTFCTFSVAVTEKWKDGSGTQQERTEWFDVSNFTKSADACVKYLEKGSLVAVEGKLESREWMKDGQKHRGWTVNAVTVEFLSMKKNPAEASTPAGYAPTSAKFPESADDLPF